jgi:hypothetical protein
MLMAAALATLAAGAGCDPARTPSAQPTPGATPGSTATPALGLEPAPIRTDADPDTGPDPAPPATTRPPTPKRWPTPEDCVSYNPGNVTVQYDNGIYTVTDGSTVVMRLYGQQGDNVGDKALALAQRFRKHCYIGRSNTRVEERGSYIFDYWRGPSGATPAIPDQYDDCSSYDRNNLTVEDMGDGYGWRVKDHDHVLHLFDNESDARNGKLVLAKHHQTCSIGDSDDGRDAVTYQP